MFLFSMIAERLAMVAEKCDGRVVIKTGGFQPRNQPPEFVICVGNFAVVQALMILSPVRLGRIIRDVRIR